MSRLLRAELRVGLAPGHAVLVRTPRGLVPRAACSRMEGAGIAEALAAQPLERAAVHVTLSNHFVRYALLPAAEALGSPSEWQAYAAHVFENTHGRAARGWTITCAPGTRGEARLASAVDTAMLEAIRTEASKYPHLTLVSVQPFLSSAFNRVRGMIGSAPTWLAVIEQGRAVLALLAKGQWMTVRTRGLSGDPAEALRTAIAREEALLEAPHDSDRLILVSEQAAPASLPAVGRLQVVDRTLRSGTPLGMRRFALAIA